MKLTSQQTDFLLDFFAHHPEIRQREAIIHGFDPLSCLKGYIKVELLYEPVHRDVLAAFQNAGGKLSDEMISQWAKEELAE